MAHLRGTRSLRDETCHFLLGRIRIPSQIEALALVLASVTLTLHNL
jgi:hypothetical protein